MPKHNQTMLVYQSIKERIDEGYYSPAENLPEQDLATEYNVSRNTIKKALLMLENDSYVNIQQNKGAKVRSFSKTEILEFMELREVLEGFIIRLTVPCITQEDIEALEKILAEMVRRREQNDLLGYSAMNREFHSYIYQCCPNRTVVEETVRLKNQMKKYNAKTVLVPGRCEQSNKEHKEILNAIIQKDTVLAEQKMVEHMCNVRNVYDKYYSFLF